MDHLLDDQDDPDARGSRELTLSTGTILALVFGLVLSWGLFFGLGYNLAHRAPAVTDAASEAGSTPSANFNAFKPAAGSPAGSTLPATPAPPASGSTTTPATTPSHPPMPVDGEATEISTPDAPIVHVAPSTPNHPIASPVAPAQSSTPQAQGGGSFMVQVAAVSHQEDADLLISALKARGYSVSARSEPQDRLVHIQVGPFNNRKDAEAMRQRLLNDGYNALIK